MTAGRGLVAGALLAGSLLAPAAAQQRGPSIIVVPGGRVVPGRPAYPYVAPYAQPLSCWSDVRLFSTLRNGTFPYCRQNLRYRPGALECFQITEQICQVILPNSFLPIETTSQTDRQVIPCPEGPEPPVCRRLDVQ